MMLVMCSFMLPKASFSQKAFFKAVNDTVDLYPGIPVTIDLMANDIFSPTDTFSVLSGYPLNCGAVTTTAKNGSVYTYTVQTTQPGFNGICNGSYMLRLLGTSTFDTSTAKILFRIHDECFDSLYLNNVNAMFDASGSHFFDYIRGARFEVPKFGGKSTIFVNTPWIGGLTSDSVLYLAAQRYGQGPNSGPAASKTDFYIGPVMDSSAYSIHTDSAWRYMWNLKKSEIDYHIAHWNQPGYQPIHDILTWPGNGNTALGQAANLAPYYDNNADGHYNAMDGDYPLILGDQALFFIMNDDRNIHSETQGNKMKIEIHGMAYVFDLPGDSAFNNTVFLNYKVFNRSLRTYYNTYIGSFTDFDIGWANDDYIGCDVQRGSYFGYNGRPVDGTGQSYAYGAHPPAQSVTVLGGPLIDPDGKDNLRTENGGINPGVNGINFGDSIVDNERYGLSGFIYFNNPTSGVPNWMQDPIYAPDYYNLLQERWKNDSPMIYGGNGYSISGIGGGYGPRCYYMFPGNSDTLYWGTRGMPPNGPVFWTEITAGNPPADRRGLGSMGPFTFHPGDVEDVDLAFCYARDYNDTSSYPSIGRLGSMIDVIRAAYKSNRLPNGESFNGVNDHGKSTGNLVRLYPNPARTYVTIDFGHLVTESVKIRVVNSNGKVVSSFETNPRSNRMMLNTASYATGLYIITIDSKDLNVTAKLSVSR